MVARAVRGRQRLLTPRPTAGAARRWRALRRMVRGARPFGPCQTPAALRAGRQEHLRPWWGNWPRFQVNLALRRDRNLAIGQRAAVALRERPVRYADQWSRRPWHGIRRSLSPALACLIARRAIRALAVGLGRRAAPTGLGWLRYGTHAVAVANWVCQPISPRVCRIGCADSVAVAFC